MARPNPELITAFRKTIQKLKNGAPYQWGHMGSCNCGNLAQEIAQLSKAEIHRYAMQNSGDWNDQLIDYCPTSGYPMDLMVKKLLDAGLTLEELMHLERLSDPAILKHIPMPRRYQLAKNIKEDVIYYMEVWLGILETQWIESADFKEIFEGEKKNKKNIHVHLLS